MRTICIMNLKGGVAKTTTTVNVAAILAHDHNKRVLVVDADSQCNTTEFLCGSATAGGSLVKGLADLLRDEDADVYKWYIPSWYVHSTRIPRVDLIPGSDELMDLDLTKVETNAISAGRLRTLVTAFGANGEYDYCLIDCPPAFNAASAAALLAADEVLIPIKLDAFSLRGMTNLMRQVENMRAINPDLKLLGCLPTMWYLSKLTDEAEATLRAHGLPVLPHIRRTDKVDDMTFAQRPIIESSPRSAAAVDYRAFVRELVKGVV